METLGSVSTEYTAKADEYEQLADALGAEGMSALEAADGADASVARDGAAPEDGGLPIEVQTPAVTFHDVGGLEGVKQLLIEKVADPIRRDELYAQYGIEPVRGVLLQGPPGTGKTLLARALGGEQPRTAHLGARRPRRTEHPGRLHDRPGARAVHRLLR
jgi:Cdc6-like AAA superfamily ATPase